VVVRFTLVRANAIDIVAFLDVVAKVDAEIQ